MKNEINKKLIILAISAASGVILGLKTLKFLLEAGYMVELIISERAYYIFNQELNIELSHNKDQIKQAVLRFNKCDTLEGNLKVWLNDEFWANPASGSYKTQGMIIIPASMSTLASIACGLSDNLIERAADVMIKEKKPLVMVPRETPLSSIHLENMLKLSNLGVSIVPPMLGLYSNAGTLKEAIDFVVGKTLDAFKIDNDLYVRWGK